MKGVIRKTLQDGAERLDIKLEDNTLESLVTYIDLLQRWNKAFNLTAGKNIEEIIERHVLDSLSLLPYLPSKGTLVDVGSGAGLPGVPLALIDAERNVLLVDSNGKKTRFLQHCVFTLDLPRVEVKRQRMELLPAGSYDVVTARAVAPLKDLLGLTVPLLKEGGCLLAQKGEHVEKEINELTNRWRNRLIIHSLPNIRDQGNPVVVAYHK